MLVDVFPTVKWHELGGLKWCVLTVTDQINWVARDFRSKRRAFKWAAREGKRLGVPVRNFHAMTSRQRKTYWRRVVEVAE